MRQLDTAIRLSVAGQVRNRFAWILLVAFVPVWYLLIGSMIGHHGIGFRLRATGATVMVDGHNLTLITAGLSSITLITGFVVFATVRRARAFDRRLVLSGYRPSALIAAKTCGAWSRPSPSAPTPRSSCCSSGAPRACGRSRSRSCWPPPPTPRSAC
jgi:hypothetical protein